MVHIHREDARHPHSHPTSRSRTGTPRKRWYRPLPPNHPARYPLSAPLVQRRPYCERCLWRAVRVGDECRESKARKDLLSLRGRELQDGLARLDARGGDGAARREWLGLLRQVEGWILDEGDEGRTRRGSLLGHRRGVLLARLHARLRGVWTEGRSWVLLRRRREVPRARGL